ncbi:hypothetical protein JW710_00530 [Candidatus Dojkabacteria bacterium]|nr:hypothetical protein [Candidatus Dojkabacteria bacterium]
MSLTDSDIERIGAVVDERLDNRFGVDDMKLMEKVDRLVEEKVKENINRLLEYFVTKPELEQKLEKAVEKLLSDLGGKISKLQDVVLGIKSDLDYEIKLISGGILERHEDMLENHEKRISLLEDKGSH